MKYNFNLLSSENDILDNDVHELQEEYKDLKNTVNAYNIENDKTHKQLQQEHDDLKNIVDSNYVLAQIIFKQNNKIFDKLEKRLDHSLKFIFICIGLVSILLLITSYIVYSIHF